MRFAKLTAFAVSAALGGISGGLIAGQVRLPFASSFTPLQSLALYVLAVMSGAYLIDMAIFGGILWVLVPEVLKRWGMPLDWALRGLRRAGRPGDHERHEPRPGRPQHLVPPRRQACAAAERAASGDDGRRDTGACRRASLTAPLPVDPTGAARARGRRTRCPVRRALKALDDVDIAVPAGCDHGTDRTERRG